MRLVVFGATGGAGRQVVEQAVAAGHQVTAVARTPAAISLEHESFEVVRGDVMDRASIEPSVAGADAVVSALGVGQGRQPPCSRSAPGTSCRR